MDLLVPQRGIVAGSASATFEAKMALIPMMDEEMDLRGDANTSVGRLNVDGIAWDELTCASSGPPSSEGVGTTASHS
eukprot:6373182-Pyramimonas_sp.AAC.1